MPRNVRDSDDEPETKSTGRRTRAALNPSVLDSPLRRSTRIKHPVHQDGSSPESISDVSSVGTTRSNRRRTTTGDSGVAETGKSLRTRRNSVASDISELTETESLPDGPPKRVTRRSIAGIAAAETPPLNLNGRARRATRAGSESKSTPPVGRTTRRNRATSLEPEGMEEQKIRETGTPAKSRRRASALPSEPAVAEESEDSGRGSRRHVEKTVYEIDEDESDSGHNISRSSRRKSRNDTIESPEKMEVDESPESPTSGANGEEVPSVRDEAERRKSASNGRSSDAGESKSREDEKRRKSASSESKIREGEEKSTSEVANENERKSRQSDEESEYDGYPAFKDIPADEWKANKEGETNSLHSASTERNESDCDLELVVNDVPQLLQDTQDKARSDYDSDATVKNAVIARDDEESEEENSQLAASQNAPMDVTSDAEEEEIEAKSTVETPGKRASLNASRKNDEKTPNKNVSLNVSRRKSLQIDDFANDNSNSPTKLSSSAKRRSLNGSARFRVEADSDDEPEAENSDVSKTTVALADTSAKGSPASNAIRRKSLQVEESANDSSGSSVKLNSSARRRSLNVSARRREEAANSDDEQEAENSDVPSPKLASRKSLDASGKKSKDRTSVSATNSPIGEKRPNESPARRNRSLNKSADDVADSSDNSTESEVGKRAKAKSLHAELMKQLKGRLSTGNASDSPASPKNRSRLAEADSDGEAEAEELRDDRSTPKVQASKSRKSGSAKKSTISLNNSTYGMSSEPVIAFQDSPASPEIQEPVIVEYRDSPQSPDSENQTPNKSAKRVSINKWIVPQSGTRSASKNQSKASPEDSDTPIEDEDSKESPESAKELEKSVKIGSAKKSASRNASRLAVDSDSEDVGDDTPQKSKKSAKIGSAKKSANNSTISLNSSLPDNEESPVSPTKSSRSASAKKSAIERNYSTIAQINSDSEVDEDVESSDDSADLTREIPKFLYDRDSDSDDDDSSKSIDSDVARDLNLDGKSNSMLHYSDDDVPADDCMATESESSDDDDDGADLLDFVVADDEDVDEEEEAEEEDDDYEDVDDDESNDSSPAAEKQKPRKRIIPRPAGGSDSDESDEQQEEPMIVSPEKSATKTPTKSAKLNKTQEILEDEPKSVDLNSSVKNPVARNKNLLIQSSTPKTLARQSLLQEKASSATKAATPANKSLKSEDSPAKIDLAASKKLSKSVCESIETPAKLGSSFKLAKTPKSAVNVQQQLQTSLPVDLNETAGRTNLSKAKSTKISTLNQTVVPAGSESPETRFLMKEKLNDSMPALKLQQRVRALRLSILDNLREKQDATEELHEEEEEGEEIPERSEEKLAVAGEKSPGQSEVSSEKKKKKRRKKKKSETSDVSLNPEEENVVPLAEIAPEEAEVTSPKKANKLSRNKKSLASEPEESQVEEIPKKKKKSLAVEPEESQVEEIPKKKKKKQEVIEQDVSTKSEMIMKKKKKQQETVDQDVSTETEKPKKKKKKQVSIEEDVSTETDKLDKKKKKKQRKTSDDAEPEVPIVSKKSRRPGAAQQKESADSDEAPEAVDFTAARDAAIRDFRKMTESIKSGQEAKRKKHQENLSSRPEGKTKSRRETAENVEKVKTSVKRLPDDLLANLSAVAERPNKRRKVAREEKLGQPKIALSPLRSKSGDFSVDEGYIPLSSAGGTTQFTVVNLKKVEKRSKKAVAAMTFRERILARNPRQPVSAYMMYLQKQKVSGKDRQY